MTQEDKIKYLSSVISDLLDLLRRIVVSGDSRDLFEDEILLLHLQYKDAVREWRLHEAKEL